MLSSIINHCYPFIMKKILFLFFLIVSQLLIAQSKLTEFVNPFIGTGGHGHTYPGASLPFGMVQLSPDTRLNGWDGCSGYHYSDSIIYGFSHTHLSGTGVEDYCDILLQPTNNAVAWDNEVYKSGFSHKNEEAHAGFYKVKLDKYNIDVELTSTLRTGIHQYTYPKNSNSYNVLLDLEHRDIVINSSLKIVDDYTVTGLRQSKSWAQNQYVYFAIKFSKPIKSFIIQNEKVVSLHLMEDVLGWIAVLVGAIIMYFWDVPVIDPILSLLIAGYVLFNVFKNMRELFRILLQGTPHEINSDEIQAEILKIESVKGLHDVHLWTVDGIYNVMTIHVILNKKKTMEELTSIKNNIRNTLKDNGIEHVTLEFETVDEECVMEGCC